MTLDINDMIAKMEQARNQLNSVVDKAAPQVEIYPTWKLKQLLDHIAGWDELMISAYRAYAKGEPPVSIEHGIDQYNAESVSGRNALSLRQSRQEYDEARQKVIQVMR